MASISKKLAIFLFGMFLLGCTCFQSQYAGDENWSYGSGDSDD